MSSSDPYHTPRTPSQTPQTPLLLRTLELTSVCATFSLTFPPSPHAHPPMSQTLKHGLAITLNQVPWTKVLVHIEEDRDDEAIVVLYGLFPGRRYDIEIGVVGAGGVGGGRGGIAQIVGTTEETLAERDDDSSDTSTAVEDIPTLSRSHSHSQSRSRSRSASVGYTHAHSASYSASSPTSSPPFPAHSPHSRAPSPVPTLADTLTSLRNSLATLQSSHAQFTAQLKSTRRDSQRSLAMLRSELDGMRRAAEKNASGDTRARQKALALGEAVRRAERATKECEEETEETERELGELESECEVLEKTVGDMRGQAQRGRVEVERMEGRWREMESEREVELGSVRKGWHTWEGRRERLEGVVQDLEGRLGDVLAECERIERGWEVPSHAPDALGELPRTSSGEDLAESEEFDADDLGRESGKRESVWGEISRRFTHKAAET